MLHFVGIDVARRTHLIAIVDETLTVLLKPTPITEDATGYEKLMALLGSPTDTLVVMEATGHYWRNLFACICARGFRCAVLNPLRIRRFAQEDLRRAKTDRTDALTIARFGAQKRPEPTPAPDPVLENVRELVRLQQRLGQDFADRVRQLHRLLFLVFPEFTEVVRAVNSQLATTILCHYPSAKHSERLTRASWHDSATAVAESSVKRPRPPSSPWRTSPSHDTTARPTTRPCVPSVQTWTRSGGTSRP